MNATINPAKATWKVRRQTMAHNSSTKDLWETGSMKSALEHFPSPKSKGKKLRPSLSPQCYLDAMLSSRGYSVETYSTLDSAYYNEPTPLQLASYGEYVVQLVNDRDIKGLKSAFSLGLSRNPCNAMGESLLQLICRQGDGSKLLSVMLKAGSDVQVSDSLGSTLLHDACQAPQLAFALIEMLLKRDINLLSMTDAQGSLPLSYVRAEHWSQWLRFLESKKEALWPRTVNDGSKPPLVQMKPNSKPITLPKNPLSLDLAKMVATGQITPNAARDRDEDEVFCDDQNDDTPPCGKVDSSASEFSYNIINDDDEDDSWNEDEMNDILQNLSGSGAQQPLAW